MSTPVEVLAEWKSDAGHGDPSGVVLETTPGDVLAFIHTTDIDGRRAQIALTPWEAKAIAPALAEWAERAAP